MDSFEINKIIAAVLLVALLIIGIGKLSDVIFYVEKPKTPGYAVKIEQAVATSTTTSSEMTEEKIDLAALMALGDLANGEKVFKSTDGGNNWVNLTTNTLDDRAVELLEKQLFPMK